MVDCKTVFEFLTGEHKGKRFTGFHNLFRLVENEKMHRYPYYNLDGEELVTTEIEIKGQCHLVVEMDNKHLLKSNDLQLLKKALVIAIKMIAYDERVQY